MTWNDQMHRVAAEGYVAPEAAQSNARRGIELVEQGEAGDGLEPATVTRAHSIANGEPLSPDHIQRMHSFFERHDKTRPDDGGKGNSPWKTAWLLWGGDAARTWANSMYHRINGGSDS